jgi:hypothetical protein
MSFRLLVAASLACACAAPAMAQDQSSSGYVGASYGQSASKLRGFQDADTDILQVEGAASFALSRLIGLQVDAAYTLAEPGRENEGQLDVGAHLAFRNARYLMVGVFLGGSEDRDDQFYGGGTESQAYLDRFTLYASSGIGRLDDTASGDLEIRGGRLQGRFFPQQNLAVRVSGSLAELTARTAAATTQQQFWGGRAEVEYKMSGSPVSLYSGVQYGQDDAAVVRNTKVLAGIRWNFSADTLYARDRAGATHDRPRDLLGFDAIPSFN